MTRATPVLRAPLSVLLAAVLPMLPAAPYAQSTPRPAPPSVLADSASRGRKPEAITSPDSPRAAVTRFLLLSRTARYSAAATFLTIPDSMSDEGPALARKLRAVLDRHRLFDQLDLSANARGDAIDGPDSSIEQLGTIPLADGAPVPVHMVRRLRDSLPRWRFSASTVAYVPAWYDELPDRWALEHLPDALLRAGPMEVLWWQWIVIPLLLTGAIIFSWLIAKPLLGVASRIVTRTRSEWDDAVLSNIQGPMTVALSLAGFAATLPWLTLYDPALATVLQAVRAAYFVVFFWTVWRLIDVARVVLSSSRWAHASNSSRALLPLASRVTKVMVLAVAIVDLLSLLGYPVASLLAGLGLGGLALALAAQKTVENLFGAFSIGIDQPFREGDFVKVEDFVGTVETLGLRATRFRTLDRTLISVPNGRLVDMRLESYSARDRMRLATVIGLVYETTAQQMRDVLGGLERVLREHPKIWPDAVTVRFQQFGASSLDIEIMAWFQVPEWSDFQAIRQDILLRFMEVVERAGSAFAFPTRTIHVASVPVHQGGRLVEAGSAKDGDSTAA